MSDITVLQSTQKIVVDSSVGSVSVINAGPQGPQGATGSVSASSGLTVTGDATISGTLDVGGATTVPAASAAGEVAQVSEYDAATGQLQIGGIEMGDTGWRKIITWSSGVQDGSNQVGTINTSNWTLSGNGAVMIRRVGSRVFVNFEAGTNSGYGIEANVTGNVQLTTGIPVGFYPKNRHMGPIGQHPHGGSANVIATGIGRFSVAGAIDLNIQTSGQKLMNCEGSYDVLGEPWPTVLPGVAG